MRQIVEVFHVQAAAARVRSARPDFQSRYCPDHPHGAAGEEAEWSWTAGHTRHVTVECLFKSLSFFAFRSLPPDGKCRKEVRGGEPQGFPYFRSIGELLKSGP